MITYDKLNADPGTGVVFWGIVFSRYQAWTPGSWGWPKPFGHGHYPVVWENKSDRIWCIYRVVVLQLRFFSPELQELFNKVHGSIGTMNMLNSPPWNIVKDGLQINRLIDTHTLHLVITTLIHFWGTLVKTIPRLVYPNNFWLYVVYPLRFPSLQSRHDHKTPSRTACAGWLNQSIAKTHCEAAVGLHVYSGHRVGLFTIADRFHGTIWKIVFPKDCSCQNLTLSPEDCQPFRLAVPKKKGPDFFWLGTFDQHHQSPINEISIHQPRINQVKIVLSQHILGCGWTWSSRQGELILMSPKGGSLYVVAAQHQKLEDQHNINHNW